VLFRSGDAQDRCGAFARNTHGAVDDPPNGGQAARAIYAEQARQKHPNGAPIFAPDGTMLDQNGARSIFDDIAE
jgi:tRNA G37 N-methylase TrmD